jgi:hypothetical protein
LGPRRERRIGLAGESLAGFDFGDDPVRIARGPGQARQQGAARDFQLRFASVPGTGSSSPDASWRGSHPTCSPASTLELVVACSKRT